MPMISILTDLHPRSDRVLDRSALIADELSSDLDIVHAINPDSDFAEATAKLEAPQFSDDDGNLRTALAIKNPIRMQWVGLRGAAPDSLVTYIADKRPDLIIVGTGREFTLSKLAIGSTVDRIVARASPAILIVKRRPTGAYRHCAVAFDGSPEASEALRMALRVAPTARLTIVLTHDDSRSSARSDAEIRIRSHVSSILVEFAERPAEFELAPSDEAIVDAMKQVVEKLNVDLAAFGRTHRKGLAKLVQGGNTYMLLSHLTCDTLIGRQPE